MASTTKLQETTGPIDEREALLAQLLHKAEYLAPERRELVSAAYAFADEAHEGQQRKSGEPYVSHPLNVAMLVADLRMDVNTLQAALLHDVVEDCEVPLEVIEERFGPQTRKLVGGRSKLSKLDFNEQVDDVRRRPAGTPSQAENLRRMLLAMAEDVRVVIIKLADRLHNMQTLDAMRPEKRRRIARETLDIYAPIANRLGLNALYRELQELAFRHAHPLRYRVLA